MSQLIKVLLELGCWHQLWTQEVWSQFISKQSLWVDYGCLGVIFQKFLSKAVCYLQTRLKSPGHGGHVTTTFIQKTSLNKWMESTKGKWRRGHALGSAPSWRLRRQTRDFLFASQLRVKPPAELGLALKSTASEQLLILNGWSTVQQMAHKWKFQKISLVKTGFGKLYKLKYKVWVHL